MSSLWKSGPLRAASPGSPGTWYLLHLWKNAPRHSLLTAKSTFYRRECGYSIVVEVTCHFQTFSTEQDWTALAGELHKKPPDWLSSASDLGATHPGLCWQGGPHYQPLQQRTSTTTSATTPSHIAAEMCEMMKSNNKQCLTTTAVCDGKSSPPESGFPSSSFPVDPDFCVTTSFQILTLALSYCQSDISNPSTKISRHFIFNLKSTMKKIYSKWPL